VWNEGSETELWPLGSTSYPVVSGWKPTSWRLLMVMIMSVCNTYLVQRCEWPGRERGWMFFDSCLSLWDLPWFVCGACYVLSCVKMKSNPWCILLCWECFILEYQKLQMTNVCYKLMRGVMYLWCQHIVCAYLWSCRKLNWCYTMII